MGLDLGTALILLGVLLASVIIHENAHGVTALALGDPTAKLAGRLTPNPVKHLDLVGSIILPALLIFTAGMAFGYAKPVPINPSKLKGTDRAGFAIVALAGPVSNVALAFIAATLLRARIDAAPQAVTLTSPNLYVQILAAAVFVNVLLAAFNMLPIPPLDGSRLLRVFLSRGGREILDKIEPFGFLILLVLIVWVRGPLFDILDVIRGVIFRILPL